MNDQYDLFVLNGVVVTDTETGSFDIAVRGGKIALLVERGGLSGLTAKRTIDAKGGYVMVSMEPCHIDVIIRANMCLQPGGVDAHVHLAVSIYAT